MAKVNRFNGNIQPFAKNATGNNRTVFGNRTVQSDDINSNLNANFIDGWEGGLVNDGTNDYPPMSYFNALGFTQTLLTAYLYQMGISEWNENQEYFLHSRVMGSDGKIYKSLVGTGASPNVGNNPTTDTVNWEDDTKDFVTLTGDQSIDDIKTFLKSPIVPTPSDTDNSNKIATTAWAKFGFSCSLTPNGYLKFPKWLGGLTIQWGVAANNNSLSGGFNTINFPIAFENSCLAVSKMNFTTGGGAYATSDASFLEGTLSPTGFTWMAYDLNNVIVTTPGSVGLSYIAIGY